MPVQAVAVLALATAFALPVTGGRYMRGRRAPPAGAPTTLFEVSVAWGVALFLLLSAGFPLARCAARRLRALSARLTAQHNYFRWAEYSLSSSVMIVLIALLTGDQRCRGADRPLRGQCGDDLLRCGPGTIRATGRVPVAVLARVRRGHRAVAGRGRLPLVARQPRRAAAFVYAIFVSLFVFIQHPSRLTCGSVPAGRSLDVDLFGERAYFVLSLVAKSRSRGRCSLDARGLIASDGSDRLSLHEAADLLGVHYMTVYRRVRLGILPARKFGGTWMIDRAQLERGDDDTRTWSSPPRWWPSAGIDLAGATPGADAGR